MHADLFVERYAWLLRVARRLVNGDREMAENLVHDAFVRFVGARPGLDEVASIDGYLVTILRNLDLTRRRRLAIVREELFISPEEELAGGDFADPLAPAERLEALHDACRFGLLRRRVSKSGSLFLLRYFLGYGPSEIALIARMPPLTVYEWLRRARHEVRGFIASPERCAPRWAAARRVWPTDPLEMITSLQSAIFSERHATCFRTAWLRSRYVRRDEVPVATTVLAEMVSCQECLARVTQLLRLPPLEERCPVDRLQRERAT